jgi:hypothetical protein
MRREFGTLVVTVHAPVDYSGPLMHTLGVLMGQRSNIPVLVDISEVAMDDWSAFRSLLNGPPLAARRRRSRLCHPAGAATRSDVEETTDDPTRAQDWN